MFKFEERKVKGAPTSTLTFGSLHTELFVVMEGVEMKFGT